MLYVLGKISDPEELVLAGPIRNPENALDELHEFYKRRPAVVADIRIALDGTRTVVSCSCHARSKPGHPNRSMDHRDAAEATQREGFSRLIDWYIEYRIVWTNEILFPVLILAIYFV